MNLKSTRTTLAAMLLAATAAHANPFPLPSSWDFGSDPGKDDADGFILAQAHVGTWSLQPDALRYSHSASSRGTASAEFSYTQVASITVTSRAYYSAPNGAWSYADILAFGTQAATVTGSGSGTINFDGIVARVGSKSKIQLHLSGQQLISETLPFNGSGGWFRLTLNAQFEEADLVLTFTATNDAGTSTKTIQHTIENYSGSGRWFGVAGYGDGGRAVDFDTLALASTAAPPVATVITLR